MKIRFYKPYIAGNELKYIQDIIENQRPSSGDNHYTKLVHEFLEKKYKSRKALLTTSCTTALEMAIRLCDLEKGDEVIVPSFTFSSTVNAILVSGEFRAVFADIDKETLNIDPEDIERKITKKTKVIMVVHYAGVAADMGKIMKIARKYKLMVIEDAAQCIEAKYKNKYLGTIGDFGCLSFHDTKNITCGEGGALFINTKNKKILDRAEIFREKGTNRTKFIKGIVDKYTWVDIGSSSLPSDILAAYLLAQLEKVEDITEKRLYIWNYYFSSLKKYASKGIISLPKIPNYAKPNGHIFYIIFKSKKDRNFVLNYCKTNEVGAVFHYIPLHSSPKGTQLGNKASDLKYTDKLSNALLRLPLYADMTKEELGYVVDIVTQAISQLEKQQKSKGVTRRVYNPVYEPAYLSKSAKYLFHSLRKAF